MTISKYIDERWSPRAFEDKKIEEQLIHDIFKAAGRAPSAFNEQPWRFIIGQKGSKSYDQIFSCLIEWNQKWAQTAPVLAISVASERYAHNNKPNNHAVYDLGASVAHLSMKAFEQNIYVHQMAGFDADKAKKEFNIPKDFKAISAIAIGYQGSKDQLPEDIAKTEKGVSERNKLNSYLFEEEWDQSFK